MDLCFLTTTMGGSHNINLIQAGYNFQHTCMHMRKSHARVREIASRDQNEMSAIHNMESLFSMI